MGIERTGVKGIGSERKMGDAREKEGTGTQDDNRTTEGLRLKDGPMGGYRGRAEERMYNAGLQERTHEDGREMGDGRWQGEGRVRD